MKRLLNILLIILMSLTMVACSKTLSPTSVVEGELKLLKEEALSSLTEEVIDDNNAPYENKLNELLAAFEYEVKNQKIDGKEASVDVEIKTYNIGEALLNNYRTYFTNLINGDISQDDDFEAFLDQNMLEELKLIEKAGKTYTDTFTLNLEKVNNEWQLLDDLEEDEKIGDAFLGGLISAYGELNDLIDEYLGILSPNITGNLIARYELNSFKGEDYEADLQQVAEMKAMGLEAYLELYDDNTGLLALFGEEMALIYNNNTLIIQGYSTPYLIEGNHLSFSLEDTSFIFDLVE